MPRLHPAGLLAVGLALALAACAAPASDERQAWSGTSTSGADTFPLTIDATLTPTGAWAGTYTLERTPPFTGTVTATLTAGVLAGELLVANDCRFELAGTLTADALDATFTPTACPGGTGGTWSATRTTPTPSASEPASGARFDDGATFDAATFR
jgi:hypothetical protein